MWAFLDEKKIVRHISIYEQPGFVQCDEHTHIGDFHDGEKFHRFEKEIHTLQQKAHIALTRADVVAVRCFKAGVPYPTEWLAYSNALRAIDNGTDTTSKSLPERPPYPAGT